MSGLIWLAAVVVIAAVVAFGLRREFARLDEERRWERIRALPSFRKIAADFERLKVDVGTALLPAMQRMAEAFAAMEPNAVSRLKDAAEKAEEGRR